MQMMLDHKIVKQSNNEFSSFSVLVLKTDGTDWFCIDNR